MGPPRRRTSRSSNSIKWRSKVPRQERGEVWMIDYRKGFKVLPRLWVVERIFSWLMRHRRLTAILKSPCPARRPGYSSL
jgi:transposase